MIATMTTRPQDNVCVRMTTTADPTKLRALDDHEDNDKTSGVRMIIKMTTRPLDDPWDEAIETPSRGGGAGPAITLQAVIER